MSSRASCNVIQSQGSLYSASVGFCLLMLCSILESISMHNEVTELADYPIRTGQKFARCEAEARSCMS